jgi:hypothetical protein
MRVNSGSGPPTAGTEIAVALTTTASMRRKAKLEKAALKTLAAQQNKFQVSFDLITFKFRKTDRSSFFYSSLEAV